MHGTIKYHLLIESVPRILYFFALCNLVIGSGAFVLSGILQPISTALRISIAAAGQVMTAYAVATALLAPALILLTAKWPRKRAIQLALSLFMLGNLVSALATSLIPLLMGRALMGAGAMFTALVSAYAVKLVAPALHGRALSTVFLGMGISYAVALPIGAWLGFEYGWHTPVWLCAAASVATLLAASWLLPKGEATQSASFAGFKTAAKQSAVLRVWLRTLLFFIAIFSVFTYVGPVLLALNAMGSVQLSVVLAIFGLAGIAGTVLGGWANDRFGSVTTTAVQLMVLFAMMCALPFTQGHLLLTIITLVVWGLAGFGLTAPQQSRLVSLSPSQAPLLLSLNSSMLYLGTALGAVVSGALIQSVGLAKLSWVGAPFALAALLTLVFDRMPKPRKAQQAA
jgi:predicted MFS family arabinose efflux permease